MRETVTRRRVVQLTSVAAATAIAGCSSGGADPDDPDTTDGDQGTTTGTEPSGDTESFDGWFDGVSNYDGVVDRTGQSEVTVEVGASGNNAFGPAAVKVSPGTTVTWEWVDGYHDVVATDDSFSSQQTGEAGHTFEHTFDAAGTTKYYCTPHRQMGMKGAVVVE